MNNQNFEIIDEKLHDWDSQVSHPLQSWAWGEFRKSTGVDVVRIKNILNNEVYQLTFHAIPHTPFTIGYFPKGSKPDPEMITVLKDIGKIKHAIYIQLEPNVIKNNHSIEDINTLGLRPSHHPLFTKFTFVLDLTQSEEDLLARMHSKTRYNIKVAQKHSVKITQDSSEKAFKEYLRLSEETTKRQRFYAHSTMYHTKMRNILHKAGLAQLWTASYKDKILAAWIIFTFQDTLYYPYGASSRDHREVMAPNLLLWEIAMWAKKNGYNKFDLWGALGPEPDTSDPWYGFHRFKQGFNPELVEYIGSYDLVIHPFLYTLFVYADKLRWKLLRMKR